MNDFSLDTPRHAMEDMVFALLQTVVADAKRDQITSHELQEISQRLVAMMQIAEVKA